MRLLILLLIVPFVTRAQLQWPSITAQTKPWTRWWWMGSAVNREDLTANMEKYRAAGLGGLELTPIYGVKGYENQFVNYLSPQWMDLFTYTLKEAKRLDLGLDMSTGTGWPFGGGPLIDSTYACRELFVTTWILPGGASLPDSMTIGYRQAAYVHTDGRATTIDQLQEPLFANKDLQALALFQVRFPDLAPLQTLMAYSSAGTILDISDKVDATGHLRWTAPTGSSWTLYGLFLGWHGKMVERAAPGAEGNVIDHFSAKALDKYLSRFDTAFTGHNLSPLRSFFNDSYEVDDSRGQSNWTADLFATFQRLRGYDLRQHLPALFGRDTKENNSRVLCDYRETISDLLLEQFTRPWHDWAHSKGALIRNQAHGSPANILDLYAASDIPETEGQEILRYKFATSAAHVTGKRLASAETVTWLNEHFLSTYSDVKKALDGFFLGGVNHVFYHGTAYTPMSDPFPGWLFYASVHFTPNDPSWPDFATLNQYVARVQSFLQQGTPDNEILLYFPIYDSWSEPGNALLKHYDRMDPEFSNTGFKECAEYLQSHGYGFDYVSDKQLLQTLPAQYKTIILPACQYMPTATLQRLIALEKKGINILVYKHPPTSVPGLQPLNTPYPQAPFPISADLVSLLKNIPRETLVDDSLACIRRNYGNGKVYFIVNSASKPFTGFVSLNTTFTAAGIFDPMTGEKGLAHTNDHSVYLQLRPGGSCLVETNVAPRGPVFTYYDPAGTAIPIEIPHQGPFTDSMKYTLSFDRPDANAAAWLLDLGKVVRNAEVSLNGQPLATLIGPEYRVTIPADRLKARNTFGITVRGGMVNRIIEMDRKHIPWKKFYNTNFPAHDRANRGADGLFDASKWTPVEEGLLGPVTLTPMRSDLDWTGKVGARSAPAFSTITQVKGADNTGTTLATKAIQSTIDAVAAKGGGTVVLKPGKYLTGSIFIKAGVTLNIPKGVELIASENFADYPEIDTRIAGIEMRWPAALINIIDAKKAALTGEGVVNARGKFCWDKYWNMRKTYDPKGLRWIVDYDAKRIRTLLIQNSEDITIKGLKFIDAGFWTVQVLYSKYVTVDGIVVRNNENGHGPSTDGVDIDSSSWVLVQNCDIDCNDDDFCLKAGRDWDGLRVNRPTEYVVIRHCTARKGGGLLTIGSETSGGIRHVLATDLTAKGTGNGFHIKSATTRGGTVEDIHIRNIHMDSVGNAILFTMNWNPAYSYSTLPAGYNPDSIPAHWKTMLHKVEPAEKGIPHFRDIYISNITVGSAKKAIVASGLEQSLITGVHIENTIINAASAGEISFTKDWDIRSLTIHAKDGSTLYIIGDSTVKNGKGKGDGGLWGWGSFLDLFFDTTKIAVRNYALGGRSSRTFITEGHWDEVLSKLKPGDYVLLQFGHNDGGPLDDTARARGTIKGIGEDSSNIYNPILKRKETVHTYGWYIRRYVADIKAKGATAIICSPIPRNIFKDGKVLRAGNDYGGWAQATAQSTGAYFIDLNGIIADQYDQLGPDKVKDFFPGDHTHTNEAGAKLNANAVITGLRELKDLPLTSDLKPIDHYALVDRHNPVNTRPDTLGSLSVGNGRFAFTVDITGLQSFPEAYEKGIPLGTESEWGWHSFPNTNNYKFSETLQSYNVHGRNITYSVQSKRKAVDYFRENPHRLQLGNIGLELIKRNGSPATLEDLDDIHQELILRTGEIKSHFTLEGSPIDVSTIADPDLDGIAVKIISPLIRTHHIRIRLRFPYPTNAFADNGDNWTHPESHATSIISSTDTRALIKHRLDTTQYYVQTTYTRATLSKTQPHYFLFNPAPSNSFSFVALFTPSTSYLPQSRSQVKAAAARFWEQYWQQSAAVDFSGSTDPRANELERRIILSQYLLRIQEAANSPPQETGLTYNSWYGRPHLEMHWWHDAQFALWNHPELLEHSLDWYFKGADSASALAKRQGYKGVRWQKMTDPAGREGPSSVGAFLIWQQPHFIYLAELLYRAAKDKQGILERYNPLVQQTADFMASYAYYDTSANRYILGPMLIPAQERFKADSTINPIFELAYWRWALDVAQQWRARQGQVPNDEWRAVQDHLASLPLHDSLYYPTEAATDAYTNPRYRGDHPVVLATYGFLPKTQGLDTARMHCTFDWVMHNWDWTSTWGWDYPLVAMTATRLGCPEQAIDALLMPVQKNTYLGNGHNYQDNRLRLYLPGNGGLLAAVALMCAGYDGCETPNPGIPKNGKWKVKWEGLTPLP